MNDDEIAKLIGELDDKDWLVRKRAVVTLGKIGDVRAVASLIRVLVDEVWVVQRKAAWALVKIDSDWPKSEEAKRQVHEFITALTDARSEVREASVKAIGMIGDVSAVKFLIGDLKDKNIRETVGIIIEDILKNNKPLLESYPFLICSKCFLKRVKKEKAKTGIFKSCDYVICSDCASSLNLVKGVKQVIGRIGGEINNYRVDEEKAYVNLWDEHNKKTRNADIDLLEIRESNDNLSYDWAVNAVLIELRNDVSRSSDYVKGIPVIIKGNPPLSENSMRILRNEFGRIQID